MGTSVHDIHDFVSSSQRWIHEEYERIQKRATEDPETAGDQGEENWAKLLRSWLPSYFHIVTKGRILAESGYASPQIDAIVLTPAYTNILLDKKLYLAGGRRRSFRMQDHVESRAHRHGLENQRGFETELAKACGKPLQGTEFDHHLRPARPFTLLEGRKLHTVRKY